MKFVMRRLDSTDADWEKLLGLWVLTPLLVILVTADRLQWLPHCMFRRITGIPCPTCESVRAWHFLLSGRVGQALLTQPLMTLIEVGAMVFVAYCWIAVLFKTPRLRIQNARVRWITAFIIAVLGVNWIYLLLRSWLQQHPP